MNDIAMIVADKDTKIIQLRAALEAVRPLVSDELLAFVDETLLQTQPTARLCPRGCLKQLGSPELADDLETRVAVALCECYGNDWQDTPIVSAGCYSGCPNLPGRDDWRDMASTAIALINNAS